MKAKKSNDQETAQVASLEKETSIDSPFRSKRKHHRQWYQVVTEKGGAVLGEKQPLLFWKSKMAKTIAEKLSTKRKENLKVVLTDLRWDVKQ